MRPLSRFVSLALAAILSACAPGSTPDRQAGSPASEPGVTVPPGDSLVLELVVPAEVRAGDSVRFTLRVRNPSPRPVGLHLLGRAPTLEVEVGRPGGDPIWRRLEGEIIPAILQIRILAPGEEFETEAAWDQRTRAGAPVPPGQYLARARLLVEDGSLSAPPVPFRIAGR